MLLSPVGLTLKHRTMMLFVPVLLACSGLSPAGEFDRIASPLTKPEDLSPALSAEMIVRGKTVKVPLITKEIVDVLLRDFATELEGCELLWDPNLLSISKKTRIYFLEPAPDATQPFRLLNGQEIPVPRATRQEPEADGIIIHIMYDPCRYAGSVTPPYTTNESYGTCYFNAFNSPDRSECSYYALECGINQQLLQQRISARLNAFLTERHWLHAGDQ